MTIRSLKTGFAILVLLGLLAAPLAAQAAVIKKAYLGQPMSDFALSTLDGKVVTLSALKGKNVMLVFPRVFYAAGGDCSICGYQYAELADWYQAGKWQEKFNLDVLYVFPFASDVIRGWIARIPVMLEAVEGWKNPKEEDLKNEAVGKWRDLARRTYPKKYVFATVPMPFPILVDEKRELSSGLDLFREEWSGGKGEQNIPAIFILDKDGVVRFKFISQHTVDRPDAAYLEKMMRAVL